MWGAFFMWIRVQVKNMRSIGRMIFFFIWYTNIYFLPLNIMGRKRVENKKGLIN